MKFKGIEIIPSIVKRFWSPSWRSVCFGGWCKLRGYHAAYRIGSTAHMLGIKAPQVLMQCRCGRIDLVTIDWIRGGRVPRNYKWEA